MGWSGGKILNRAGHCHTAYMYLQREHGSIALISSTTEGTGCLCWDLDISCGCHSTNTPEYLLWGEERREHRVLLWCRAHEQKYIPNQLHWGVVFQEMSGWQKKQQMLFPCLEEDREVFGEMVSNCKSSQRDWDVWRKNRAQGGMWKPRTPIIFGQSAGWLCLSGCFLFWKGLFLLVFLFLKFFVNSGGTQLISEDTQPVAPTSKGHRKGPACVFPFLLLHLSYTFQTAAKYIMLHRETKTFLLSQLCTNIKAHHL